MANRKRLKPALAKPPKRFPIVIKIHVYDESGLTTCTQCGQKRDHRLHLKSHTFSPNFDSKLGRCMCGYNKEHRIHKERKADAKD